MKRVKNGLHPVLGNKKIKILLAQPSYPESQDMHSQPQITNKGTNPLPPDDRKWLKHDGSKAQNESYFKHHIPGAGGKQNALDSRKRNFIFDALTDGILLITIEIRTEFPELYNVLTETPLRYNANKAEVSMDELVDYLEVITYQLDDFRKSETNHKE
ncbi:MAG: hypothetical protein RIR11_2387 [Bacteroidota bacterium]